MSCMSSRAMNIACTRANLSRDRALVMFFYMRLEKHLRNDMYHDLLLALTVVRFDHLIRSTHSSDICSYLWSESESCRTSFAGDFFSILEDKGVCWYSNSELEGSRTSFAGGCFSIVDDMSVCCDSE
jgi:hypothetical protein